MTISLFTGRGVGFGLGVGCGFGVGFGFGGAPINVLGMGVGGGCGVGLGVGWGFGLAYGARYIDSVPRFRGVNFKSLKAPTNEEEEENKDGEDKQVSKKGNE